MRKPIRHEAKDGTLTWRVRFRQGGVQTSHTFRAERDALAFAAHLDGGGVTAALAWLDARETKASALTFGEFFDHYVAQLTGVSPRTREDYQSLRRRYLAHLDATPLPLLTRQHVTSLVNGMDRAGRAPKTIKSTVNLLSTCLALAIDEGHLTANPCKRVRLPTQQHNAVEARFLTGQEFAALVGAIAERYRPLVIFLAGTGLRWSEATALQARHVDLKAGTVRVEQAWKRVPGQAFAIGPPKTRKSKRTVNAAIMALAAVRPLLGKPSDLVFTTRSGGPVRHANFYTNVWAPACKAAGLDPAPRIHDLRHTHASWLISSGIQLEAVQDQLGHESILTTRGVYGHLLPALGVAVGRAASEALEQALSVDALQGNLRVPAALDPGVDPAQ